MKRIAAISIIFTAICIAALCAKQKNTEQEPIVSNPSASPAPAATSGPAAEEEIPRKNQTYIRSTFTDLSGKKHVLDLGWIDMKKRPATLYGNELIAVYGQVVDGHYYYLRERLDGKYVVLYRDKGEKVADVKCDGEAEVIIGTTLEGDELYLLCFDRKELLERYELKYVMKCVNLVTGSVEIIPVEKYYEYYCLMEKNIYAYDATDWCYFDRNTGKCLLDVSSAMFENDGAIDNREVIDGKVYYMDEIVDIPNEPHPFIQIDLEKKEQKVLFEYTPVLKGAYWARLAGMTEEGIYIEETNDDEEVICRIPLHGGKIKKMKKPKTFDIDNGTDVYKNHYVYVDKKNRIHHVNRKNHKDTVISNKIKGEIDDLSCAEEGIFIRCSAEWIKSVYEEDGGDDILEYETNDLSVDLYYMDYKGKNLTRLAREVE